LSRILLIAKITGNGRKKMLEIYKDGDRSLIKADARSELLFIEEISELFSDIIEKNEYAGDWEFQFRQWLPMVVDLCCRYRNYKSDVFETTTYWVGEMLLNGLIEPNHILKRRPSESPSFKQKVAMAKQKKEREIKNAEKKES
jgi:hypothetical protein